MLRVTKACVGLIVHAELFPTHDAAAVSWLGLHLFVRDDFSPTQGAYEGGCFSGDSHAMLLPG